jgi:plastocyanin
LAVVIPVRVSPLRRTILATAAAALATVAAATDQTVQVGPGLSFSPSTVTVGPGETVTWQFQAFHTSTSDSQTGAEVWDSGFLSSGSFSHTFQTPGTYPYYCQVHSVPGGTAMNGVVIVSGAGPPPPPPATATPVSPTSTPVAGAGTPGVPDLDAGGRIVLAFTLAAAGVAVLLLTRRR